MLTKYLDKIVWFAFLALTAVTPLIFSTQNTELFEVPKMHFVYIGAIVIFFTTLIKQILEGKILVPKSWPLLAFLILLSIQTASTLTSIDKFTSIFGYPSRLNGGLLSQFAYAAVFYSAIVNLNLEKAKKILMTVVVAALAVSAWGIPSHFGKDPNCLVLVGQLSSTCWQKEFDPTLRIFSTLGQPNWLASYLILVLPISLAFTLAVESVRQKIFFAVSSFLIFTALIFSNSRAGFFGAAVALVLFILLLGLKTLRKDSRILAILLLGFVLVSTIFGNFLFTRIKETLSEPQQTQALGGTESGQIRLIVWKGGLEAFKHRPLLGWGPETFAYSYYKYRPLEHNTTTEWNFFYNKAHNEFVNYLSNTGVLGLVSYLAMIALSLFYILKNKVESEIHTVLKKAAVAAVVGYLASIFFGFSIVAGQLTAYLILASLLTFQHSNFEVNVKPKWQKSVAVFILFLALYIASIPVRTYLGDLMMNRADSQPTTKAIVSDRTAISYFPAKNPFYMSEYAVDLGTYANALGDNEAAQKASENALEAEKLSPSNLIIQRRVANTYILLSDLDEKYGQSAINSGRKILELSPTDPQSYLTMAKIQAALSMEEDSLSSLNKSLELKPDYIEARELLQQLTTED